MCVSHIALVASSLCSTDHRDGLIFSGKVRLRQANWAAAAVVLGLVWCFWHFGSRWPGVPKHGSGEPYMLQAISPILPAL